MITREKLARKIRRFLLGERWKHLYTLHPDFKLTRTQAGHDVLWKKTPVGQVKAVEPLHNSASGACFIVATGPSLAQVDLKKIEQFDTISLNGAILQFNKFSMAPTYAISVDRCVFERCPEFITQSINSGAKCFFSPEGISRICEYSLGSLDNCYLVESISKKYDQPNIPIKQFFAKHQANKAIYFPEQPTKTRGTMGFSHDAAAGFFAFKTVAGWAVQLAVWLGYTEIFILGMDLGGTGKAYCYPQENNKPPNLLKDYDPYIKVSFEQVKRASQDIGFHVYNLSEHSTLPHDIIPKITLDEALAIAKRC